MSFSDLFGIFVDSAEDEAVRNAADKTVFTSLFKSELLKLLPDKYNKEDFYNNLVNNKYIIQTKGFTWLSNSGDKFDYNIKKEDFENYLRNSSIIKNDNETIDKVIKYYDSRKSFLYWGGKKNKRNTKSKRNTKRNKRNTKSKRFK
jgi:6-phosphogluconate dehydrogenase